MKNAKRYLAVALSFALFLALPLAFTQEAAAASKTKVTQLDKVITVSTNSDNETSTSIVAYAYDKKGLNTLRATQDKDGDIYDRHAYAYNKSGYLTSEAGLNDKNEPEWQDIYTVKKGRTKAIAEYAVDGAKVDLTGYAKYTYKNGKVSKLVRASADGKMMVTATYKKGILSNVVLVNEEGQCVWLYDKYGNKTSQTFVSKDGSYTWKMVNKNTYKNGKLVKVVWASSDSTEATSNGLIVYTYKKGKLVKDVSAETRSDEPGKTYGETTVYAYTKGGLIKTISYADTTTTSTGTTVNSSWTEAYQYKNVAVDKKCVKAVKAAMEDYSYGNYLPGNGLPMGFWYF